jgi:hypothetical protein
MGDDLIQAPEKLLGLLDRPLTLLDLIFQYYAAAAHLIEECFVVERVAVCHVPELRDA